MLLAALLRVFNRGSSTYGVTGELYRDMNVEYNFIQYGHWPLLGPSSSLGGFNFGAIYYYLLAPFVWLFHFAPYGAVLVSGIFSVLSVFMLYRLLRLWFSDKRVARLGAFFLAISVFDIQYSYYVSNPNLMPFFVLWCLYCLSFILQGRKDFKYFIGFGLALGAATQLHATALLLLPFIIIICIWVRRHQIAWIKVCWSGILCAALYIPYAIYEARHVFSNTRGIVHLGTHNFGFTVRASSLGSLTTFLHSWLVSGVDFFGFFQLNPVLFLIFLLAFLFVLLVLFFRRRQYSALGSAESLLSSEGRLILASWLIGGLAMFVFFQHFIPQFYFLILWPIPIILFAWLLVWLSSATVRGANWLGVIYILAQVTQLAYLYPILYNNSLDHAHVLAYFRTIRQNSNGQSYVIINNFADINLFYYYERLTGLDQKFANADNMFIICAKAAPVACPQPTNPLYWPVHSTEHYEVTIYQYKK